MVSTGDHHPDCRYTDELRPHGPSRGRACPRSSRVAGPCAGRKCGRRCRARHHTPRRRAAELNGREANPTDAHSCCRGRVGNLARAAEAARSPPPCRPNGSPKKRPGRAPQHSPGQPKPTAQRNFTDPESRIMKGHDGFIQAYNPQSGVDADAQIMWRIASPTTAPTRTLRRRCSTQRRPTPVRGPMQYLPITAFARKPTCKV